MLRSDFMCAAIICAGFISACEAGQGKKHSDTKVSQTAQSAALAAQLPSLTGGNGWTVDSSKSSVKFRALHNGSAFIGDFSAFAAAVNLDLSDPSGGEIYAVIDLASVDANDDDRNANLPSDAWFDIAAHPVATYRATDITGTLADGFVASGTLNIKGISRAVELEFKVTETNDANAITAYGEASFSRLDFKVGEGADFVNEYWVKFPIDVLINITARKSTTQPQE